MVLPKTRPSTWINWVLFLGERTGWPLRRQWQAVALRLAAEVQPALTVTQTLRRAGIRLFALKMASWRQLAQQQPVFFVD